MKNIRRNICSLIILIIVLLSICIPSYASILEVDKEKLEKSFDRIFTDDPEDNLTLTSDVKLKDITNSTIELEFDGQKIQMNYEITENSVVFKQVVKIKDGMSYEEYQKEIDKLTLPLLGYVAVADVAGVELEKTLTYLMSTMLKTALGKIQFGTDSLKNGYMIVDDGIEVESNQNLTVIKKSEFGKYAIEYAKATYENIQQYNDASDFNTYIIQYAKNEEEGVYTIGCAVTANLKADFSPINKISFEAETECTEGEHKYSEEIIKEATCGQEGMKKYTCSNCKNTYYETIEEKEHNYVETIAKQPTCTQNGTKKFTCSNCKDTYTEQISNTGHDYVERMRTERGCEKDGTIGYVCSTCGTLYTKVISKAKGHDYDVEIKEATCTEEGTETYKCNNCSDTYTKVTESATGHDYKEETLQNGSKKYTCVSCNDTYTDNASNVGAKDDENDSKSAINILLDNIHFILIGVGIVIFILVIVLVVLSIRKKY